MTEHKTESAAPIKAQQDLERAVSAVNKEAGAVKDQLGNAGERLREEASTIADKAKTAISDRAYQGKETVADGMTDFAAAVRRASDELGERDQSMAASLVREVASGLEDASHSIKGHSVQDLTRSVTEFARSQPAAFLLGATVAGMALGRFVKATDERSTEPNRAIGDSAPPAAGPRTVVRGQTGEASATPDRSSARSSRKDAAASTPTTRTSTTGVRPAGAKGDSSE